MKRRDVLKAVALAGTGLPPEGAGDNPLLAGATDEHVRVLQESLAFALAQKMDLAVSPLTSEMEGLHLTTERHYKLISPGAEAPEGWTVYPYPQAPL